MIEAELIRADNFKTSVEYSGYAFNAKVLYDSGNIDECKKELKKLPSNTQLVQDLIERLEGKSVYTNIKRIVEGKETDKYRIMAGYSSLITHAIIECEHGREYYMPVVEELISKLQRAIYS